MPAAHSLSASIVQASTDRQGQVRECRVYWKEKFEHACETILNMNKNVRVSITLLIHLLNPNMARQTRLSVPSHQIPRKIVFHIVGIS